MAQAKSRSSGSTSSGRRTPTARSGGTSASGNGRASGSSASRSRNASTRSAATRSRATKQRSSQRASSNGVAETVKDTAGTALHAAGGAGRFAVKNAAVPLATAAVGAAAGVVLGQRTARRPRKVLGVPIPGTGTGIDGLAKNIGEAGKQFGKLATEVKTGREKAERLGKALS